MLVHPQFDPIAVKLGPLSVHWYGLTYLAAFLLFLLLARLSIRREPFTSRNWTPRDVEDVLFFGVLGVVLGGRLCYVLFYQPSQFIAEPLRIFQVWQGGMSFHGGLIGVILSMMLFGRLRGRHFFDVADLVAPCVPIGLAAGRVGNFINGELWGRLADPSLPWAMVFPQAKDGGLPRHPSQIYQFLLEGLLLFVLLWIYSRKPRRLGAVSGWFLIGYGVMRFAAEYFREPDAFLKDAHLPLGLTMGQLLCVPMLLAGAGILLWSLKRAPGVDSRAA